MLSNSKLVSIPRIANASDSTHAKVATLNRTTPVISVRHAEVTDSPALQQLLTEPQVIYWTIELPFTPIEKIQKRISGESSNEYVLVACEGNDVIGTLKLSAYDAPRLRHVGHIGPVAVHPSRQGEGIGSKLMQAAIDLADKWLNLHRLDLYVYVDNAGAIALYEKFGFTHEGIMRGLAYRDGKYADIAVMARIRE